MEMSIVQLLVIGWKKQNKTYFRELLWASCFFILIIMKKFLISLLLVVFLVFSCKQAKDKDIVKESEPVTIQVQGHRGERGHMPENSIAGFIEAIKDSVDVIEMDVVISKDRQIVVSHEPFMSSKYVSNPEGVAIESNYPGSYKLLINSISFYFKS